MPFAGVGLLFYDETLSDLIMGFVWDEARPGRNVNLNQLSNGQLWTLCLIFQYYLVRNYIM